MSKESVSEVPVEIPPDRLSPETLRRVVEEYVGREGTDYGHCEFSLDRKVEQVISQLEHRTAVLVVDASTGTFTIRQKS